MIDDDVFGPAAVPVDGDDLLTRTELFDAWFAERAFETSLLLVTDAHPIASLELGDVGTGLFDDSDDLMARNQGKPRVAPIIVDVLDVAPRDAAVRDPHQDVVAAECPLIREALRLSAFLSDRVGTDLSDHADLPPGNTPRLLAAWPSVV